MLLAQSDGTLADKVALIEFVWRAAPLLSLAHDVGDGGLAHALAEASAFSGHGVQAEGEALQGSVVLACTPGTKLDWPHLRELGTVT